MTDDALLTAAYRADRRIYMSRLRRQYGLSSDVAEDIYQAAFLSAWESIQRGRCTAITRAWVWTIVRNRAIDYLRRARFRRHAWAARRLVGTVVSEGAVLPIGVAELTADELRDQIRRQARARYGEDSGILATVEACIANPDVTSAELAAEWGVTVPTAATYRFRMRRDGAKWRDAVTRVRTDGDD
jgi:DNA-directed RNA polymerase specialized sigma24 family protein